MELFGGTFQKLENSLNYASAKNRTISNNIANVDTPNYKSKDVAFKNVLNEALNTSFETKRTHPKHISFNNVNTNQSFQTITNRNSMYNHNGNNVDIDKEMSDLAKNQIYYRSLVDRMNGKFSSLQTVIRGGR
ncbi:flagellar basal-body rod protein FlgB [Virgibacillus subterraneus]|uniref:Flagellar basal body rod protein FlgB n=2 Tax=Virgibacillus TaxID=84406 RepID=A0A1H1C9E9_9BACI|nr:MULTISPECIES: flagellar basal body rod protein FlgB [Virgibacillus]SDQ60837.1 flagellar basal-body rod protein FlgB [Virgibacillus salinus]SEQ58491.1 flagellar basal-body rod protein FlgB [Virgibacillus subterraneus]